MILCISALSFNPFSGNAKDNDWLYGQWVTVGVSKEIVERNAQKSINPVEKHILIFKENGDLIRYSQNAGLKKILLDFKVDDTSVLMQPKTKNDFISFGKIREDGKLEIYIPPKGGFLYKKNGMPLSEIDLEGSLPTVTLKLR